MGVNLKWVTFSVQKMFLNSVSSKKLAVYMHRMNLWWLSHPEAWLGQLTTSIYKSCQVLTNPITTFHTSRNYNDGRCYWSVEFLVIGKTRFTWKPAGEISNKHRDILEEQFDNGWHSRQQVRCHRWRNSQTW